MMKSFLAICIIAVFCVTYSHQRAIKGKAIINASKIIKKDLALNNAPPDPPSLPLLIRKKRELDFGGLFDGFGLGEDVIKMLIEKITELIMGDCGGDSQNGEGTASGAPQLRRRKRDFDLSSLGLDGLGLDADTLQKLTEKIMDFITGNEADCGQAAVTGGTDGPKPTEAGSGGGASGATDKPPASGAPQTTPGAVATTAGGAPATTKPVPAQTTAKPDPPAATTEGAKPTQGSNTGGAVTDGVKPTPPLTEKPTETPAAPTTRRCRPNIQLCFF